MDEYIRKRRDSHFNAHDRVWKGPKLGSIYNSNVSLGYLILKVLEKTPELITQVSADNGEAFTCREMRLRTIKIAQFLQEKGYEQGDVVGIVAANSENVAPLMFACWTLGLTINPLDPAMTEKQVIHMFSKTKPRVIFVDATPQAVDNVMAAVKKAGVKIATRVYTLREKYYEHPFLDDVLKTMKVSPDEFVFPVLDEIADTTAVIMSSSGTSGLAKGVAKSYRMLIQSSIPFWNLDVEKKEVYFNFGGCFWGTNLSFLITATLNAAKRIITAKEFDPKFMIDTVEKYQVTTFYAPPHSVYQLLQYKGLKKMESLRIFMSGGAFVSQENIDKMKPYLPNGKLAAIYATAEGDFVADRFFSDGYVPSPNVRIKIVDKEGKPVAPNKLGEIIYQTGVMFTEYVKDTTHEDTAESLKDGWIYSGDIGYFDGKEFLIIEGRKKEIIRIDPVHKVHPAEIERIINQVPGVVDSCVVGIPKEEEPNVDLIYAFAMKDPEKKDLTEEAVAEAVNTKVDEFRKLKGVQFVDAFPLTPTGKVERFAIKDMARDFYGR